MNGKYYRANLEYIEQTLSAYVNISWTYPGAGYTLIPSTYIYSPEYVSKSPYQVSVVEYSEQYVFVIISIVLLWVLCILSLIYPHVGRFTQLEYLQMISILALTDVNLTSDMNVFFSYVSYSLIGFQSYYKPKYIVFYDGDKQDKAMLSLLRYYLTSTSANIVLYIAIGFIILSIFLITKGILKLIGLFYKIQKWADYVDDKIPYLLIMRIMIRYLLLGWLYTIISSIYEIYHISERRVTCAIIYPIIVLVLWISFLIFVFWCSIFIKDEENILIKTIYSVTNKSCKDKENNGNERSKNRFPKLYTTFFLLHRILIVISLAVIPKDTELKIFAPALIQIIYIGWLVFIMPFSDKFSNFQKIYKEICILCLLLLMLGFYYGSDEVIFLNNLIFKSTYYNYLHKSFFSSSHEYK